MSFISDGEAEEQHLGSEPCKMRQETVGEIPGEMKLIFSPLISAG